MTTNLIVQWKKSTYSGANGDCVEAALTGDGTVLMRDTKLGPDSPTLSFDPDAVHALIEGIKAGEPA